MYPTASGLKNKSFACRLLRAGFLPSLLFNPEDEGEMFLRNVG
jgi:hypothetical protein